MLEAISHSIFSFFAQLCLFFHNAVRQPDRQRHEVFGLVAGVPEHHALVAGALAVEVVLARLAGADLFALVDALGDVGRLLVDRHDHTAGVAVEAVEGVVVADAVDDLTGELGDVDVRRCGDLTGNDAQTGGQERLAEPPRTSSTSARVTG